MLWQITIINFGQMIKNSYLKTLESNHKQAETRRDKTLGRRALSELLFFFLYELVPMDSWNSERKLQRCWLRNQRTERWPQQLENEGRYRIEEPQEGSPSRHINCPILWQSCKLNVCKADQTPSSQLRLKSFSCCPAQRREFTAN